jgi:hypothetical protein
MNQKATGRYVLNTHMITMPFSGPEELSKISATNLPRSSDTITKLLKVNKSSYHDYFFLIGYQIFFYLVIDKLLRISCCY